MDFKETLESALKDAIVEVLNGDVPDGQWAINDEGNVEGSFEARLKEFGDVKTKPKPWMFKFFSKLENK